NRAMASSLSSPNGNLTDQKLIRQIRDEVIKRGSYTTATQLKHIIRDTRIARVAERGDVRTEQWICSQLYGALRGYLSEQFYVDQEKYLEDYDSDTSGQYPVDLYIRDKTDDSEFLVEAKIAHRIRDGTYLKNQVEHYHKLLSNRKRTFILIIVFDDDYWKTVNDEERAQLDDFMSAGKKETIESISKSEIITRVLPEEWER
ncbi:MAG: hypothetical protein ABEI86_01265, partial [Halobacteriaceae archaeon]